MLGFLIFLGWLVVFGSPLIISAVSAARSKKVSKSRWWFNALWAISGLMLIGIVSYIFGVWTDALWFQELGQVGRFWTVFWSQWRYFLIGTAIFTVFVGLNIKATTFGLNKKTRGEAKWLTRIMYLVGFLVALIFGACTSGLWKSFLMCQHQVPFGTLDPIFHKDIAFYVFNLPVLSFWRDFSIWAILVAAAFVGISYLIQRFALFTYDSGWGSRASSADEERQGRVKYRAITHLSVLGVLLMAAFMFVTKIGIWNLLFSTRGFVFGAGYTDVHVQIVANSIFFWILLVSAIIFLVSAIVRSLRLTVITAIVAVGLCFVTWLGVMEGWPSIVQHNSVAPNELTMEQPYIQHNIAFTREAYGLTGRQIKSASLEVNEQIDSRVWQTDSATLNNVRIWDWRVLQSVYNQTQAFRLYYDFPDVDVLRYPINGKPRQMMAASRELDQNRLIRQAQTWQNKRLVYTHGFGACANPVNVFTPEGMPDYALKNIPPQAQFSELQIGQPRIYYGEQTTEPVYVATGHPEFDYPRGDSNATCSYDGPGGIAVGSGWRKLAFAFRFDGIRLLIAHEIKPQSKVMFRRDLNTRVTTLAPFLGYDNDPYQVIAMDSIWFIWDAYTTTSHYPYSEPCGKINYIRNSVKVVMNAYSGKVDFYVFSPESDPLIQAYMKMFPGFFKPASAMPAALRQHIRYPEDILRIQGWVYGTYHMDDPTVFYNKEDAWQIAKESSHGKDQQDILPYFIVMRLPGEKREEFVQILPFTPYTTDSQNPRNNMVAWLAARCDGEYYGEIILYKFSKDELIYGPLQIGARINQDENISKDMTLWNQQGSRVVLGNLLVIPLSENRLIYVQPIYLQAEVSRMPELKRVVVAFGDKLAYGTSFEDAFGQIVGPSSYRFTNAGTDQAHVALQPNDLKLRLQEAERRWEAYRQLTGQGKFTDAGRELEALGQILSTVVK